MEELIYVDRRGTNCAKWDNLKNMFGEDNLHAMWVADMDFQVPGCVKEALHKYVEEGVFGYYAIPDSYYQAFMNWEEKRHGLKTEKEWLRFSPGVVAAFHWLVQIFSEPGDAVIINTPVYYPFSHAVNNNGRKLITSELINSHGTYTIDFEDFEKKIVENDVKIFILCSPHNPAGRVWTAEELKTLFDICRKHQVFVISDEIHQDLVIGDKKQIPSYLIGDYKDMMIAITAPSKTFNLAGGQNSIVMIPDEGLRAKWDAFVQTIRVENGNPFGYIAAEAAYNGGEEWLESVLEQLKDNYAYVVDTFAKELPDVVVSPLEGTYLCWIDLGAYVSADEMKEFIQTQCGLAVDYGDWFGGKQFGGHIRMNLATSLENVKIGVDAIVKNLK